MRPGLHCLGGGAQIVIARQHDHGQAGRGLLQAAEVLQAAASRDGGVENGRVLFVLLQAAQGLVQTFDVLDLEPHHGRRGEQVTKALRLRRRRRDQQQVDGSHGWSPVEKRFCGRRVGVRPR